MTMLILLKNYLLNRKIYDSKIFIADKLSDLNKTQLDSLQVNWIELRSEKGYQRFEKALENLNIPFQKFEGDIDKKLEEIFREIF